MKGEAKMVFKSKMKWIGLVGLVLSAFSIFIHFLLARYTEDGISDYQSSITIFSWRPIFENADLPRTSPLHRKLWGPVRRYEPLNPDANPRGYYADEHNHRVTYEEYQWWDHGVYPYHFYSYRQSKT